MIKSMKVIVVLDRDQEVVTNLDEVFKIDGLKERG